MQVFFLSWRKIKIASLSLRQDTNNATRKWSLNATYTFTQQTAGSWARILDVCPLKRIFILFLWLLLQVRTRKLPSILHTQDKKETKIIIRLLVLKTERESYTNFNIIKKVSINHFEQNCFWWATPSSSSDAWSHVNATILIWYQVTLS